MNFQSLQTKIEKATRKAFIEMYELHAEEGIYSFALYSDEGAMTVCPATNTLAFLNNHGDIALEDLAYYKFEPAEWKYEMMGADEDFDDICDELRSELEKNEYLENDEYNEAWFEEFQNGLYQTCFEVLKKLKDENFFRDIVGKDIFLTFSVTDSELDREKIKSIISELNNEQYTTEYFKWMETWGT